MHAVLFPERDEVQFATLPDPVAGPGQIVVKVRASGICHTDLEVLSGNYGSSAFPVVPGHEFAGTVADVGAGVTAFAEGDAVVIDPNFNCGTCRACRKGWAHLCEALGAYGVTTHGGFAEYCVVDQSAAHKSGDLPFDIAALAEPMGCVLNGMEAARSDRAETALIFGAGPMGLLMAMALKARGASAVTLVDRDDSRLALADSLGFPTLAAGGAELAGMKQAVDLVVDATGVPAVAATLVDYTANGGTCHFFGVCPSSARIEVAPFEIFRRQLSLVGSHSLNHNIPQALDALRAIGPEVRRLISHSLPFDEIVQVMANGAPAGSLKIQAGAV